MLNLRNYFANFQEQLSSIHALFMKANALGREHSTSFAELGPAFLLLGQLENELCEGLTRTGTILGEDITKMLSEQHEYEEFQVAETLTEYVLLAAAATEVLRNRDKKAAAYHESVVNLRNLIDELEKAKLAVVTPDVNKSTFARWKEKMSVDAPTRVRQLEEKIIEAEKTKVTREEELKKTTAILIEEMERFHVWKLKDFKTMLLEYIGLQVDYHKKAQAAWESLLPVVEGISKPSKRSTWWVGNTTTSSN
eukprot:TRINITY_DN1321_c0_g1_i3.p1 TRINITY_DN1321_c0_g1~~TRINITY_DN1321_c0_g1_i3.p1  ORF type:complete len:252 (-),score=81.95 TRINITY_DN1321_c0_g1_i3:207-962(-)